MVDILRWSVIISTYAAGSGAIRFDLVLLVVALSDVLMLYNFRLLLLLNLLHMVVISKDCIKDGSSLV